jgi:putative PEP-CTERM system histidine kinase
MAGFYSYLSAALGFGLLTLLLLPSWRSSLQGRLLTLAAFCSTVWAAFAVSVSAGEVYQAGAYPVLEILRYIAWYGFLLKLLAPAARENSGYRRFLRRALPLSIAFAVLLLGMEQAVYWRQLAGHAPDLVAVRMAGHVALAIMGLAIVEQLFRNTASTHLWAVKYLFMGMGVIFAFDLYLYADALLFRGMDRDLWDTRGFVNALAVPLLALTAARNRDWSLNLFVSRDIVLHTSAILGGGLYLLVMAGAGYYLREFGGDWGRVAQMTFFSLAVLLLLVVLSSSQLRTRMRVFLGKHFYKNKYDYRHEWLRLTGDLYAGHGGAEGQQAAIRVLAHIVDARAGLLWLRDERGDYSNTAAWQTARVEETETAGSGLAAFLAGTGYVINLQELDSRPDEYAGLVLPPWVSGLRCGWLVVPLVGMEGMLGFVVLTDPLVPRSINWEDRDLLKAAAKQTAGYLAVLLASEALARARQFEVFNRLSAYMVHDLKNIGAELDMVAKNAERHGDNPEFLQDAFATVATASGDIRRLMEQLRSKRIQPGSQVVVDLRQVVTTALRKVQAGLPVPQMEACDGECLVVAEKDRIVNVIAHLLANAQQATSADGFVRISLTREDTLCVVDIRDNGHGMDADFLRDRLFMPFDTTRGNAGLGIGMYESREFMRQCGGEIQVASKPGEGTQVTLRLPATAGL